MFKIVHEPAKSAARGDSLTIRAKLFAKSLPDSVVIYPVRSLSGATGTGFTKCITLGVMNMKQPLVQTC